YLFPVVFESLKDKELRSLLAMRDLHVDRVCLDQIRKDCRYELRGEVLGMLNEKRSPIAKSVLESLLAGPDPFRVEDKHWNSVRDPLTWLFLAHNDPIQREIL